MQTEDLATWRKNLSEAWAALATIRETVEKIGLVAIKAREHLQGPPFMDEAIVAGIRKLAEAGK